MFADKRDVDHIYEGGGEDIEVQLSIAEMQAIYGDTVDKPTWVKFSHFDSEGGSLARDGERRVRKNELGKILTQSPPRDLKRTATCFQSDDETLMLIELLETSPHLFRYALAAGEEWQVWGLRNAVITNNWEIPTADEQDRKIQIELTASPEGAIRAYEVATVAGLDAAAQDTWPAKLDDFKDAPDPEP